MTGKNEAEDLRLLAASLQNGKRGDIGTISDGMAMLLRREASRCETGYVTPAECAAVHKETIDAIRKTRFGWPAAAATITCFGGVLLLIHQMIMR